MKKVSRKHDGALRMDNKNISKVMIVGGGTAGWMCGVPDAGPGQEASIQLIESDEISTIGVGEATIPPINNFNIALGIDENEFIKATQATFKLGIQFKNWGALGDSYIHGFGTMGQNTGLVDFMHYLAENVPGRTRSTASMTTRSTCWPAITTSSCAQPMKSRIPR